MSLYSYMNTWDVVKTREKVQNHSPLAHDLNFFSCSPNIPRVYILEYKDMETRVICLWISSWSSWTQFVFDKDVGISWEQYARGHIIHTFFLNARGTASIVFLVWKPFPVMMTLMMTTMMMMDNDDDDEEGDGYIFLTYLSNRAPNSVLHDPDHVVDEIHRCGQRIQARGDDVLDTQWLVRCIELGDQGRDEISPFYSR